MSTRIWLAVPALILIVVLGGRDLAYGRGGRGGGGMARPSMPSGGARPSFGGARPGMGSAPSFSRPVSRPSQPQMRPSMPSQRPSSPNFRPGSSGNRPSFPNTGTGPKPGFGGTGTPGQRPGGRPGTFPGGQPGANTRPGRPSTLPGSGRPLPADRPSTLPGTTRPLPGNRPTTLPENRPSTLPGTTRPFPGERPGQLPGLANRPETLPGLGGAIPGNRLPGNRLPGTDRPQTLEDRRAGISDRMASTREHWQQQRPNWNHDDWQDHWQDHHQDWHQWDNQYHYWHASWYHGCWHGGWYPGNYWNHVWNYHPAAAAYGLTVWGVNRVAYGWGYWPYVNPWYVSGPITFNYSQPLVVYSNNSATPAAPAEPDPKDPGLVAFDEARDAFVRGEYPLALTLLDTTLKTQARDPQVHQFRGLVLFALQRYQEGAAAVYAVLSAGPGWDWTTMIGLYPNVDVYTEQLRALEAFARSKPKSADAHFLLGYHYLTGTHPEAAGQQFKLAQSILPNDRLIRQLVGMTNPSDSNGTEEPPADVPPEKVLQVDKLVGEWKATRKGESFQLDLRQDGRFAWTYASGGQKQAVEGVFNVDQNVLALEVDDGSAMLAEVDFRSPNQFVFQMVGDESEDPGLTFQK